MPNAFLKIPIEFESIYIYPPSVKECIEEPHFNQFQSLLLVSQDSIEEQIYDFSTSRGELKEGIPTPFEILLGVSASNEQSLDLVIGAIKFFTHLEPHFIYGLKEIWLGSIGKNILETVQIENLEQIPKINENNFFEFQQTIRKVLGQPLIDAPIPNETFKHKRFRYLNRKREAVKAKTQNTNLTFDTLLAAVCCMGCGLNPLNIGEASYASIFKLVSMYQQKEAYEIDVQSVLAGADTKKVKPQYWIRNFTKE